MSKELYCELTPIKPVYQEMKDEKPFAYGRFYGTQCHIAWGIRSRLKEDLMEPRNERVYFYRYWKMGDIVQGVPWFLKKRHWTKGGDVQKFSRQQGAGIVLINKFPEKKAFTIELELRANHPVQFFHGPDEKMKFVREVPNCRRENLERIGPFDLEPEQWINTKVRPTFRLASNIGEDKYRWMEFYRANVYYQ